MPRLMTDTSLDGVAAPTASQRRKQIVEEPRQLARASQSHGVGRLPNPVERVDEADAPRIDALTQRRLSHQRTSHSEVSVRKTQVGCDAA